MAEQATGIADVALMPVWQVVEEPLGNAGSSLTVRVASSMPELPAVITTCDSCWL